MPKPLRNLSLLWHRLFNKKKIMIDDLWVSTDPHTIPRHVRSLLFKNVYEDQERELVRTYLKQGDRVLEIGTGIGMVSLLVNNICGPGNVRSYEANPDMESLILANFSLNGIEPDLHMKAITKDGSKIEFFKDDRILSSSSIDRGINSTKCVVESDALETVLVSFKPNFIVMDVEGAEVELLKNTDLKSVRGLIVELHPHIVGQKKIDALVAELNSNDFQISVNRGNTYVFIREID